MGKRGSGKEGLERRGKLNVLGKDVLRKYRFN